MDFDILRFRAEFPALDTRSNGHFLVYLDNAATTQIPSCVHESIRKHYLYDHGNVHRGIHSRSEQSTRSYENARKVVADSLGAMPEEIIFTAGTTDGINKVAISVAELLKPGDEIITTPVEHHSNLVPWQELCRRTGARLRFIRMTPDGELDLEHYHTLLSEKTKLVTVTQCSNVLGAVYDVAAICAAAHDVGALVLVDGAQGFCHTKVDVKELGCDFYCFSGHKVFAPTGIGALFMSGACMARLRPPFYGGGMVDMVGLYQSTYEQGVLGWEAGTPNFVGAIALAEALKFRDRMGAELLCQYTQELTQYAVQLLSELKGVHLLGEPKRRTGILSFTVDGLHPFDIAVLLDQRGIAVRSGTHCAQPLLYEMGLNYCVRASIAPYNTREELQTFCNTLKQIAGMLGERIYDTGRADGRATPRV